MNFKFKKAGNIGIFILDGKLTEEHENDLKILLIKALHSVDRAIIDLKKNYNN